MRIRFFVALVLTLGLVARTAPGFRLSADHRDSTIVGNAACVQDFPSTMAPDPRATVVMCGLDNPRGLAFSESALYVAEAGRGGLGLETPDCYMGQNSNTINRCSAPNGAISRLWKGIQQQVVTGLPSDANRLGRLAIGPHDIALVSQRRRHHRSSATAGFEACDPACAYVTIGLRQPPEFRERYPFLADFAKLVQVRPNGEWSYVADLGAYEAQNDPDQDEPDTNPYSLLVTPSGRSLVVTDAGGNSMLRVRVGKNGKPSKISTLAVFPQHPPPDDSVPTTVAVGPDGAYYVGEFTGSAAPGAANIYRVRHAGEPPVSCVTGFRTIIDIAFDHRGNLYVLEYVGGTLWRVALDKHATRGWPQQGGLCAAYEGGAPTVVVTGLTEPTSVAVGPDGALYISNRGSSPGTGEVIRFEPPFE